MPLHKDITEVVYSPRDAAVMALRDREGNVSAHLDRLLRASTMSQADRALARELALGTVRRQGTLRAVLAGFLSEPGRPLPGVLKEILLVATYQVLFLQRIPEFAAVNEAVDQSIRFRHRRQSGLINGVLRNVVRSLGPHEPGRAPLRADVLPVSPQSHRQLGRAVFPDPLSDPAGYVAAAHSLPAELAGRWLRSYGPLQRAAELAVQANVRAPLILRPNTLKTTPGGLLEMLRQAGVSAALHQNGQSIVLENRGNVTDLPGFADGAFQPQDPTATAVGDACGDLLGPGVARVLDFCAAPGGKTTHLAQRMGNGGLITALDVSPEKLQKITDNCRRMGITNVQTQMAQEAAGLEPQSYDLVLVDAPCSNTGVLSRRPEARWRFSRLALDVIVRDQQSLLSLSSTFVRPGGYLVYSTCSIEPEECGQVGQWFLHRDAGYELVRERFTLPQGAEDPLKWFDGGYHAVLKRRA